VSTAILVEHLSKRYRVGRVRERHDTLRDLVAARARRPLTRRGEGGTEFWALDDVSLSIDAGEVVGIVGRNGAGKSTLLKLLSRITAPTRGRFEIHGVVGSLLEVGTGFHPELTGRENVFLNGAILGMPRSEIRRKFDDIVEFAEIGAFIDTPVKRYSSGMYVRLAFSVAAHFEPEVLLVDEVLSVGDQEFQRRCLGRVREISQGGRTVLFVSHNLAAVSALCSRGVLLERGRVAAEGDVAAVLRRYAESMRSETTTSLRERPDRDGNGDLRFTAVTVAGPTGPPRVGEPVDVQLDYDAERACSGVEVAVSVQGPLGEALLHLQSRADGRRYAVEPGRGTFVCRIPELPLLPATYSVNVFANFGGDVLDWVQDAATFEVVENDYLGHGHLPSISHGHYVVRQAWDAE
jgi:lipopolysaccharide transport system ATP-binding protein